MEVRVERGVEEVLMRVRVLEMECGGTTGVFLNCFHVFLVLIRDEGWTK